MRTSIIVAMGQNCVIGTATGLPWHLPRDLKHFRTLTLGKPVILGRKTIEQIGCPLPGRTNIVLTRQAGYYLPGALSAHSVDEALDIGRQEAEKLNTDEMMIIGGGEVYRAFLPHVDRVYLTIVAGTFEGTSTFPYRQLESLEFQITDLQEHAVDDRNGYAMKFFRMDRTSGLSGRSEAANVPETAGKRLPASV